MHVQALKSSKEVAMCVLGMEIIMKVLMIMIWLAIIVLSPFIWFSIVEITMIVRIIIP